MTVNRHPWIRKRVLLRRWLVLSKLRTSKWRKRGSESER